MLLPRDAGKEKSFPTGPLIKEKKQTVCQSVEKKRVVSGMQHEPVECYFGR